MMEYFSTWIIALLFISKGTCSSKTDCSNKSKISVLLNLQNEKCENIVENTNLLEEPKNNVLQMYNYTYNDSDFEIAYFETCGSNIGTLKAIFKTIMWTDVNCLQPPYFLGFIGPDKSENLNFALKITSALKIPHIVSAPTTSPYTHHISTTKNRLLMKGIFKLMEIFGWKSFLLKIDFTDDLLKNIAQQFIKEAVDRKLCVQSNNDSYPYIVYIGTWNNKFFNHLENSSVILLSNENIEKKVKNMNSTNSFLLFDNIRYHQEKFDESYMDLKGLHQNRLKFRNDSMEMLLIQEGIKIYTEALNFLCKNKNCYTDQNSDVWNNLIAKTLFSYIHESKSEKSINFKVKEKNDEIKAVGKITENKDEIRIYWNDFLIHSVEFHFHNKALIKIKNFLANNETRYDCIDEVYSLNNADSTLERKSSSIVVSEMSESEWWTMVGTVTGVGIAMFTVGFLAVYIVYTNIRGPKNSKSNGKEINRDSSLRRIGSGRKTSLTDRNSRTMSGLQRRDSRSSMRSNISDKSV